MRGPAASRPQGGLELSGIHTVELGGFDDAGVTESGIYTVRGDTILGWSPDGEQRWAIARAGSAPDPRRTTPVLFHDVLLVGWQDSPGYVAYSADTGAELWSTAADGWWESGVEDGSVVLRDPATNRPRWTADPARWSCAAPFTEDNLSVLLTREVALLRCPTRFAPDGTGLDLAVAAFDRLTGAELWHRRLTGTDTFVVDSSDTLTVKSGGERVFLALRSGDELGRQPVGEQSRYRFARPGGTALIMDSTTLAKNTEMRFVEPDGGVRWTAPLAADEEVLLSVGSPDGALLATLRPRSGGRDDGSLLAYDVRTGERTRVAGARPTSRGEEPLLTMPVAQTAQLNPAPWGVLVLGADGRAAVIPSG
ncbi:PQQ-binding-like beta-propeller repeat protein [Nocardia asteroides]|uniref:outer membrane protein assembly factor BamB family protein n=1 Tax=Nocardia asteroides TaxID=1824 RepID=UPI001E2B77DB|nr:PQQ-binding-like beta-propeller repeat protein [Nocardia asteroides]UGT63714.1 PQQ-like beta-propeller repeat protein [Nocardia asteroides]